MTYKIGDYVVYTDKKWEQLEAYGNYLSYKGDMYNLMILEEQIEKLKKNNHFIITKIPTLLGTFEATYNGKLCKKLKIKDSFESFLISRKRFYIINANNIMKGCVNE